jgi:hypothetical protein
MVAYLTDSDQLIHYVADAAQGTAWQALPMNGAPRNVVINGAMQVAQRGTSTASITTDGYYTADRMIIRNTSLGTWTQSIENDAPTGSGFRKSLKMLCTTADAAPAAGDILFFGQINEGQNLQRFLKGTASAKQFSLSFWVKSNVTGTYIAELQDLDNTRQVSASYTVSASATWEKKTITFPADTTGAFDNDNAGSLSLNFWLGAGSDRTSGTLNTTWASLTNANRVVGQTNVAAATNNYWQITGVQLEAGAVATPFEFEDYGVTLAKCQRYYYQNRQVYYTAATAVTTNAYSSRVTFPTTMRADSATVTVYSGSDLAGTSGSFTAYNSTGGGTVEAVTVEAIMTDGFQFFSGTSTRTLFTGSWKVSAEL